MSAIQVWHEYLPARVTDNAKIYRNFEIAGLVNQMMLDTRIIGRDKQIRYADYLTQTGLNTNAFLPVHEQQHYFPQALPSDPPEARQYMQVNAVQ